MKESRLVWFFACVLIFSSYASREDGGNEESPGPRVFSGDQNRNFNGKVGISTIFTPGQDFLSTTLFLSLTIVLRWIFMETHTKLIVGSLQKLKSISRDSKVR